MISGSPNEAIERIIRKAEQAPLIPNKKTYNTDAVNITGKKTPIKTHNIRNTRKITNHNTQQTSISINRPFKSFSKF